MVRLKQATATIELENAMKLRFLLSVCLALTLLLGMTSRLCRAQTDSLNAPIAPQRPSPFSDVPAGTWPFAAGETLQKAGITFEFPYQGAIGGGGRRETTRYEFAVAIARLLSSLSPRKDGPSASADLKALRLDVQTRMEHSPLAINALMALLNEFAPELKGLGYDASAAKTCLAALRTRPFSDVPPNHWAFSAVESLRQSGIVVGYPKGDFRTDTGHD